MCVSERIFSSVFKIPYNSSLLSWYNGCLTAETNALNIKWLTQVSEQRPSHSWTGVGVILDSKWSENSKWVGSLPAKVGGERNFEVESNSLKFFVDIKLFVGFIFLFGYLLVEYQVLGWGSWFIWSLGWYQSWSVWSSWIYTILVGMRIIWYEVLCWYHIFGWFQVLGWYGILGWYETLGWYQDAGMKFLSSKFLVGLSKWK